MSPGVDDSVRQYARLAQDELSRMAHITRQMLGFYRESSKSVPVQITELLDSVLDLYGRRIRNSGAVIEKMYEPVPPIDIYPGEMRQVFSNLLLNALDAVGEGGRVRVHVYASPDWRDPRRSRRAHRVRRQWARHPLRVLPEEFSSLSLPPRDRREPAWDCG